MPVVSVFIRISSMRQLYLISVWVQNCTFEMFLHSFCGYQPRSSIILTIITAISILKMCHSQKQREPYTQQTTYLVKYVKNISKNFHQALSYFIIMKVVSFCCTKADITSEVINQKICHLNGADCLEKGQFITKLESFSQMLGKSWKRSKYTSFVNDPEMFTVMERHGCSSWLSRAFIVALPLFGITGFPLYSIVQNFVGIITCTKPVFRFIPSYIKVC